MGHIGQGNLSVQNPYQFDIRPSAIFDIGILKLKAGWEYGTGLPGNAELKENVSRNGFGVAAQVVLAPYVEFGGTFSRGFNDVVDYLGQPDVAVQRRHGGAAKGMGLRARALEAGQGFLVALELLQGAAAIAVRLGIVAAGSPAARS